MVIQGYKWVVHIVDHVSSVYRMVAVVGHVMTVFGTVVVVVVHHMIVLAYTANHSLGKLVVVVVGIRMMFVSEAEVHFSPHSTEGY